MTPSLLYARKQLLPSQSASTLQSMNMAAAFAQAGNRVYSFPGIKGLPGAKTGDSLQKSFAVFLREYNLTREDFAYCRPLRARQRGLYGLSYRAHVMRRYLQGNDIVFTRDITDALTVCRARSLFGKNAGRPNTFLFEMHEVLHAQHREQNGKHNWQRTQKNEHTVFSAIDGLVVINEKLALAAKELFGYSGPCLIAPSGFNPALFHPLPLFSPSHPWPGPEEKVHLAYIGNMHENKGVTELIHAMALLPSRFHLRIIGGGASGPVNAAKTLASALGLGEDRISFMGHMPQKEIWSACAGCHMALVPQQTENAYFSPIKINESLALGLPTITTPLSLFAPMAGLIFTAPDSSPQGLAAAITQLWSKPLLARELRERGIAAAAAHTWLARARRILDFASSLK